MTTIPFQDFIFNTWIPFLVSFTLLYGVLEGVKIFDRRINLLIAFLVTLAFSASPFFEIFSQLFIKYAAFFVVTLFLVLFIGGGLIFGKEKFSSISKKYSLEKELKKVRNEIENCEKEIKNAEMEGNINRVAELRKRLIELREREKTIEEIMKK